MDLEFYFDLACPHAYVAATQVESLADRHEARLRWRPVRLSGIYAALGVREEPVPEAKRKVVATDLGRWADWYGLDLVDPGRPVGDTSTALCALLAAAEETVATGALALFEATWAHGEDPSDPAVVRGVLDGAGLDGAALLEAAGRPDTRKALDDATEAAVRRGVFGVPTFFVGDQMFWGQDRLRFVSRALAGWRVELPEMREAAR